MVIEALGAGWSLDVDVLTYVPMGAGSYHWLATTRRGDRHFVTADDLRAKPWLGSDNDSTFEGLRAAFDTAVALRERAGLGFVVAPIGTGGGASLHRVSPTYSVAVFPFIGGRAGDFAEMLHVADRARRLHLLAELHRTPLDIVPRAERRGLELAGREALEHSLGKLNERWSTGPYSEPARAALAARADVVLEWLRTFDDLALQVAHANRDLVITHGEPHPANVMSVDDALFLIDWDTVGLAVPERDLWMLDDGSADAFTPYTDAIGTQIDPAAISLYRLTWTLADVAAYLAQLRQPHEDNADTRKALDVLTTYLR